MLELHRYSHKETFTLESGEELKELELAYHCSPGGYHPGDKVVWLCHGLTANSDAEDWWPGMVGPGLLFDPEKYFIVCVNMLGSCYGSTGPSSVDAELDEPYMLSFPMVTIRDMVRANILVREHLGIEKIDLLVGPSIGGFQAIEWAVTEPDRIGQAVFLATGDRVTPYMTAFNESQRLALLADPSFLEEASLDGGQKGLACARSIALISYRTYDGYNMTQKELDEDCLFADRAGSYQRYQGEKLVRRFDAYTYWTLTKALDSHNIGRGRGGVEAALARISCPCLVICVDSDCLFTPKDCKLIASGIAGCAYREISSAFGHDGFLIESAQLSEILKELL